MKKPKKTRWMGTFEELKNSVPTKALLIMAKQLEWRNEDYRFTVQISDGYLLVW